MATVKWRRKRWVCDWRRPDGRRGFKSFKSREAADRYLVEQIRLSGQHTVPVVDPRVTVAAYVERWLELLETTARYSTFAGYRSAAKRHLTPRIGTRRVTDIDRQTVRSLLIESRRVGFAPNTVRFIHRAISGLLAAAVEDGLILANPAHGVMRGLGLGVSRSERERVLAMTRGERDHLLAKALSTEPRYHPLLFTLSRTGLRIGEALALRWTEVDLPNKRLRVVGQVTRNRLGPTKSGRSRSVELSPELAAMLTAMKSSPSRMELGCPEWVFTTVRGCRMDYANVSKAWQRIRVAAELPVHFTIHSLRHTYARIVLEAGGDVLWLQRQLGHSQIGMTADLYGKWAEIKRPGLADTLDSGSTPVAKLQEKLENAR